MPEFDFTVTVRVEGDPPKEYDTEGYALQFAATSLARLLAIEDHRPFAENVYNHLSVSGVSLTSGIVGAPGQKETHHEPAAEHQPEAEEAKTLGFSSEEIAAARTRNTEQP